MGDETEIGYGRELRSMNLEPGTHLWLAAAESVTEAQLRRSCSVLSLDEQNQAERFYFEHDRARYVLAHALARTAMAYASGCNPRELCFRKGRYGRPHVERPVAAISLGFSISHTKGLVGVALTTRGPIGLDIESLEREVEPLELGRSTMTDAELAALRALDPRESREQFLRLWVLKESYLKARGTGFSTHPTSFSFRLDERFVVFVPPADDARSWIFQLLTAPPLHVVALCSPAPHQPAYFHDGSELLLTLA